jgi:hypothetical protein
MRWTNALEWCARTMRWDNALAHCVGVFRWNMALVALVMHWMHVVKALDECWKMRLMTWPATSFRPYNQDVGGRDPMFEAQQEILRKRRSGVDVGSEVKPGIHPPPRRLTYLPRYPAHLPCQPMCMPRHPTYPQRDATYPLRHTTCPPIHPACPPRHPT